MAKLTKKQYTRKHLFIGIAVFMAVVLIVTGLSVWLLLGTLSQSASGNLGVSSVAVSPMSFVDLKIDNVNMMQGSGSSGKQLIEDAFVFDSRYGDDYGRVTWDGESYEKLSITVTGTLSNADCLRRFFYVLELPSGIIEAAKAGYLNISEFYNDKWEAKEVDAPVDISNIREDDSGTPYLAFKFTISLKWGEKFGGENPGDYFDRPGIRDEVDDGQVEKILNEFKNTVMSSSFGSKPTFSLTLTASPNK